MNVYLFAVGFINVFDPVTADAVMDFIQSLPGFVAVHPDVGYTLLCFDTLANAITSRGMYTETGNQAGRYIMNGRIDGETLIVDSPAYDTQGGPVQ